MTVSIKRNQRNDSGFKHGPWEDYMYTGRLWCKGNYRNGERHGLWEAYHSTNYQLWYKGEFKKEKLIGLWYEQRYD
jgi:antitoxin component YwqK of YwqJK toxin-antitoxin module